MSDQKHPNTSPTVHCLPVELLQLTFNFFKLTQSVPLLTLVCRRWREIAINTPELWNSITVFIDANQNIPQFQRALQYSGSLPLDIVITRNDFSTAVLGWERYDFPVMHLLKAQIHRWRVLKISTLFSLTVRDILVFCRGQATLLEELYLWSRDPSRLHISDAWKSIFRSWSAPSLRVFDMGQIEFNIYPGALDAFPSLESFAVRQYPTPYTVDITPLLIMMQPIHATLTKLEFDDVLFMNFMMEPMSMTFPVLKEFVLTTLDVDVACNAIAHVHAPSLHLLRISGSFVEGRNNDIMNVLADDTANSRISSERDETLRFHFPQLSHVIIESSTIYPESVLRMVETRLTASLRPCLTSNYACAITKLEVTAFGTISEEDRDWFRKNVSKFNWSSLEVVEPCNQSGNSLVTGTGDDLK